MAVLAEKPLCVGLRFGIIDYQGFLVAVGVKIHRRIQPATFEISLDHILIICFSVCLNESHVTSIQVAVDGKMFALMCLGKSTCKK